VKRRVERSLIDLDRFASDLLDPLRDRIAVRRFERERLQNQPVERALRDRKARGRHVASTFDMSAYARAGWAVKHAGASCSDGRGVFW
jgi:hypothetical protein